MPCRDGTEGMDSFHNLIESITKEEVGTKEEHLLCEACFKMNKNGILEGELLEWFKQHREEDRQFRLRDLRDRIKKCWNYNRDFEKIKTLQDSSDYKEFCEIKDRLQTLQDSSVEMLMKIRM